jgi:hypothetical protein
VFGDKPVLGTDFSSFESHHSGEYAELVAFWIDHMTRNLKSFRQLRELIKEMVLGVNKIEYEHIVVHVYQRLMSGVLWTSSANGMLNLLIMSYISTYYVKTWTCPEEHAEYALKHFKGFVEGDDGICVDSGHDFTELIEEMGLNLEMIRYPHFCGAGFCSIICDSDELVVLKDPIPVMRKIFLLPIKYAGSKLSIHKALIRSRALSYKWSFGSCPMIGPLCDLILEKTRSINIDVVVKTLDNWDRANLLTAVREVNWQEKSHISDSSRMLVEQHFGVSIADQLEFESSCLKGDIPRLITSRNGVLDDLTHAYAYLVEPKDVLGFEETWATVPPIIESIMANGYDGTLDPDCLIPRRHLTHFWIAKAKRLNQQLPVYLPLDDVFNGDHM